MDLNDIIERNPQPEPWYEGDNIPWDEPGFSKRMLAEHLSQAHDAASRRVETIDRMVEWTHNHVLERHPSRILDLGCGPGLYASRLTALGHRCTGIDFSPASISHAQIESKEKGLAIDYIQGDLRTTDFPQEQDLVMQIYGELNVFSQTDAHHILKKASASLTENGRILLEVHAPDVLETRGREPVSWTSARSGLWSDSPHICLQENFWYPDRQIAVSRFIVIDPATGKCTLHSASYQDYTHTEYETMLQECGFSSVEWYPSIGASEDNPDEFFTMIMGRK